MKKLMLVYPNQRWQKNDANTVWNLNPHTLCLLGTMVKHEVDVKIVDAQFYNLSEKDFEREVRNYSPDYVGISVMTTEYSKILDICAQIVKNVNTSTIVIAGGVHVTIEYESVMKNCNIDYAIRGEGEYVLRDLIKHLNGNGDFPSEGVVYRKGELVKALPQAFIQDLSKIYPSYRGQIMIW